MRTKCVLWKGPVFPNGYGRWNINYHSLVAHRETYRRAKGPIPAGLVVRHKCDNRLCVRLDHLELGTQADNIQDAIERGRHKPARLFGKANGRYKHGRDAGRDRREQMRLWRQRRKGVRCTS